jgi:hypothetical protein
MRGALGGLYEHQKNTSKESLKLGTTTTNEGRIQSETSGLLLKQLLNSMNGGNWVDVTLKLWTHAVEITTHVSKCLWLSDK